jgi:uncharacterized protein (DUF427 family)
LAAATHHRTIRIEGNHYFPADSVRQELLLDSPTVTWCYWKGKATYRSLVTDDGVVHDIAWVYERPWPLARRIAGHLAFDPRVRIER